jgi:Ca-activated chloride channel homolog
MQAGSKVFGVIMLTLAAAFNSGCKERSSGGSSTPAAPRAPAEVVPLRLVHDPAIGPLLAERIRQFDSEGIITSSNRKVKIELTGASDITAARDIASGKLKVDAWLASSRALINYANSRIVNLGAEQVECRQLFGSPIVLVTSQDSIRALGNQAQMSWKYIFDRPQEELGGQERRQPTFSTAAPAESFTGLAALLQTAFIAAPKADALDADAFGQGDGFQRLKQLENSVNNYGLNEQELLQKVALQRGPRRRFVLTTEQQMVAYNLGLAPENRLAAVYLSEGSVWQDFSLCRSNQDWVSPDRRAALKVFSDFLASPLSQEAIRKIGFRPAAQEAAAGSPLTKEYGVRSDLPKVSLLPPAGSLVQQLLDSWPLIARPAALVLVLDLSGSMEGDPLRVMQQECAAFLKSLSKRDLAAVVTFATEAKLHSDFTTDHSLVSEALNQLEIGGGSAAYDGMNLAVQIINQRDLREYRKTVVMVIDGPDKNSESSLSLITAAIKNTAARQDIDVVVIGIKERGLDPESLNEIVQAGHGSLMQVSLPELSEAINKVRRSM